MLPRLMTYHNAAETDGIKMPLEPMTYHNTADTHDIRH